MNADTLQFVLEATGYLIDGKPAHGVFVGDDIKQVRDSYFFSPDALWRGETNLTVYFKYVTEKPEDKVVQAWHKEIWNEGFAPLLWVISPNLIELYNGFGRPDSTESAANHCIRTFDMIDSKLIELDQLAGRLAMETGRFSSQLSEITKATSVDQELLKDLGELELELVSMDLPRIDAQGLIGRAIFTQYLVDRKIVDSVRLEKECGESNLPNALCNPDSARRLFNWLSVIFNGDMFPQTSVLAVVGAQHLEKVADFLLATNRYGQKSLFPYQFNVIPIELLSSIYEKFAHSSNGPNAEKKGVHYTRLPVVSLILDEVLDTASGVETVLDITCGSGVFLVEAFRRLVRLRGGKSPSREIIRETLYNQIYGIDESISAINVAAFSLYLAALELDPNPQPPEALKFHNLIGRTLICGDAFKVNEMPSCNELFCNEGRFRKFDIIVGNPPWTFGGKDGTKERQQRSQGGETKYLAPRGVALDFVSQAIKFGHKYTRYGLVLSAPQFFATSNTAQNAVKSVIEPLKPITLVNLSSQSKWLFPTAKMPAIVLLARNQNQIAEKITIVNVPYSPACETTHSFNISPSDVRTLKYQAWIDDRRRLKMTCYGRNRDLCLIDDLRNKYNTLGDWLNNIDAVWKDGLILGKTEKQTREAEALIDLDFLDNKKPSYFHVAPDLLKFNKHFAQWPRKRDTYNAPLLLVKEFYAGKPRPFVVTSDKDLVYTDSYFGASVGQANFRKAQLVSAILTSAFGGWFFLLTASEFGVFKRRLFKSDVTLLPIPDLDKAIISSAGQTILKMIDNIKGEKPNEKFWSDIDDTVFELYGLTKAERIIVKDGMFRAGWQWVDSQRESVEPADIKHDITRYANAFMEEIDTWLQATNKRKIRAEIFDTMSLSPVRIIRFVLEKGREKPSIKLIKTEEKLTDIIKSISNKLNVKLGEALFGVRELRIHGRNEVIIIKPSARRFWLESVALEDADIVVSESSVGVVV